MVRPEIVLQSTNHHYLTVWISKFFENINISEIFPEMFLRIQLKKRGHFNTLIVGCFMDFLSSRRISNLQYRNSD
jgi:hypothetical protein